MIFKDDSIHMLWTIRKSAIFNGESVFVTKMRPDSIGLRRIQILSAGEHRRKKQISFSKSHTTKIILALLREKIFIQLN